MDKRNEIGNRLIERCYKKSAGLLKKNSTDYGFLACSRQKKAVKRNYLSIFSRDSAICSLGALASGDKSLIRSARLSLATLKKFQAADGEIPNYVKPKESYIDFWKVQCIDATLWWLIAIKLYDKYSGDKIKLAKKFKKGVDRAINWMFSQEHECDGLVVQNEASDWADLMPRDGKVLYANTLWLTVKRLYSLRKKNLTAESFNNLFYPFNAAIKKIPHCEKATVKTIRKKMKPSEYYLSFVNYLFWGEDIDVYGNSLAIMAGTADKKMKEKIVHYFLKKNKTNKLPIPALFNPVKESSKLWRDYMKVHNQNYPYQYHNGGIWPYTACFWAMALHKAGYIKEAWKEMEKIAHANSLENWRFSEWLHPKTQKPMGMKNQSWNAGAFIFAYHYLKGEVKL